MIISFFYYNQTYKLVYFFNFNDAIIFKIMNIKIDIKKTKIQIFAICIFLFTSINLQSQTFQTIGTVNPSKYVPAQKDMAEGQNGMVTSQHFLATKVGEKILNRGGNAYDAAIAIGFTLAVVLPRAGNIGGGGFMVMHDSKTNNQYSIDYREIAPMQASQDMYLDADGLMNSQKLSTFGYLASGVPGTVAGLWEVHSRFGSLEWSVLLEDAINFAENGFEITPYLSDILKNYQDKLSYFKETEEIFMKHKPKFLGQKLVQKDLANTLRLISKKGKDGFYKGVTAKKISEQMSKNGGLITLKDLQNYKPVWREPLKSSYRDTQIITMGPPSSGGVHVIQMLNILENYDLLELKHNSPKYINLLTEAMKYAYADRSKYLGDPDFYKVPISKITDKNYAYRINKKIKLGVAIPSSIIKPGTYLDKESDETTHYSVADKEGNVVSSTYTLNSTFGSGVTIKGTGILMNNEMDDFSAAPNIPNQFGLLGAEANKIVPLKRPLSSMTPTIVMKNGQFFFSTGSPGGSRIISAVLQSIINIVDFDMDLEEANRAKRLHHQWQPDVLQIEFSVSDEIKDELTSFGYNIRTISPRTCLQTIMLKDNIYTGYGDFRRPDAFASGDIYDR